MPRRTKAEAAERAHYHYLAETLRGLEPKLRDGLAGSAFVPDDWREIAARRPRARKVKLSLRVEEDVVKFFRLMGPGYLQCMNDVLRVFMHARLAGVIEGADAVAYHRTPQEEYAALALDALERLKARAEKAGRGQPVREDEAALRPIILRLCALQDEMELPEEHWVLSREAIAAFFAG